MYETTMVIGENFNSESFVIQSMLDEYVLLRAIIQR